MNPILERIHGPLDDVPGQVHDALTAFGEVDLPPAPTQADDLRTWAAELQGKMANPTHEKLVSWLAGLGSSESYKEWYNDVSEALSLLADTPQAEAVLLDALVGQFPAVAERISSVRTSDQLSIDIVDNLKKAPSSLGLVASRWIRLVVAYRDGSSNHHQLLRLTGTTPKRRQDLGCWTASDLPEDATLIAQMIAGAQRMATASTDDAVKELTSMAARVATEQPVLRGHLLACMDSRLGSKTTPTSLLYLRPELDTLPSPWQRVDVGQAASRSADLRPRIKGLSHELKLVPLAHQGRSYCFVVPQVKGPIVFCIDEEDDTSLACSLTDLPAWCAASASERQRLQTETAIHALRTGPLHPMLFASVDMGSLDLAIGRFLDSATPDEGLRVLAQRVHQSPPFQDLDRVAKVVTALPERTRRLGQWLADKMPTAEQGVAIRLEIGDLSGAAHAIFRTPEDDPARQHLKTLAERGFDLAPFEARAARQRKTEEEARRRALDEEQLSAPAPEGDLDALRQNVAEQEELGNAVGIAIARAHLGVALLEAGGDDYSLLEDAIIELPRTHPMSILATKVMTDAGLL